MSADQMWDDDGYRGLTSEFDPDWMLSDAQQALRERLIELCRTTLRANAVESDEGFIFPRKNFEALAGLGLLGLSVPKTLGGLGENHVATAMVVETIARYGCASTAMCYVMHCAAVAGAMLRHHDNTAIQDLMRRLDTECLVGTLSLSDPATGSHIWFLISSKAEKDGDGWRLSKKASWTTSDGFADWYIAQTTSPDFDGDYAHFSTWLVMGNEIRAYLGSWDGMGLKGNQSGPIEIDNVPLPADRLVGPVGDGAMSNEEATDPFFLFGTAACWNGIAMGMIDIVRKHMTRKKHVDVGLRVCDYPTIQDYVGEAIISTNTSRMLNYEVCRLMDDITGGCDWSIHSDVTNNPRADIAAWTWQAQVHSRRQRDGSRRQDAARLRRHRLQGEPGARTLSARRQGQLADGPNQQVIRNFIGKAGLLGFEALDLWNQEVNQRTIDNEIKKMSAEDVGGSETISCGKLLE